MLMDKKHYSPFEFGTIYLTIPFWKEDNTNNVSLANFYERNPYSRVYCDLRPTGKNYLITTNLRVIIEHERWDDLKYQTERTQHIPRICVKIVTSRDISLEFVRHRAFSFLQESTRYCNYNSSKFDNNVTFVIPA